MRERILTDLITAMKMKDKDSLSVLRMIKGSMQLDEIKLKRELNDEEVIAVIAKQIKTRKESITEFEKGNRQDLIEQANKEIDILNKYMPEQLNEDELNKIITDVFAAVTPSGPSDMGKIMGLVAPKVKGKADLSLVNKLIKKKLNNI